MRSVLRFGTLCGVMVVMAGLNMGGCIGGLFSPCNGFDASDGNACTVDTCEEVDGVATAVHTPKDCGDQVCDPTDGACVDCLTDDDCAQGFCSEAGGNVCVACVLDSHCAAGQVCTNAQCVGAPECTDDAGCAEGQVCTNGECVAGAGCTGDADCAAGEVCTNGACVAGVPVGDPVAGEAFYTANGCAGCHGANGSGGLGPDIRSETAADIFARLSGAASHPITVPGVTVQDSLDLEAWLNTQ